MIIKVIMYLLKDSSSNSEDPLFLKMPNTNEDLKERQLLFFPEVNVAKWFYESGIAEKNLIHWICDNLIKEEKNFLDIGAHVGTYSFICGKKANHTYSFECNPKIFCYLAANIALHKLEEKITPYRYALGDDNKMLDYYIRSDDGGGNGVKLLSENDNKLKRIKVEMRTLDSFKLENIGLIKIDVEGFEKEVLFGGLETLIKNNYPPIIFESWGDWKENEGVPAKQIRNELLDTLKKIGYETKELSGVKDMFLSIYTPKSL
jgi:FkbM family methyltransferase